MTTRLARRVGIVAPLRHRDFRLLWTGLVVSLLGDGIFLVAVAWEAYRLDDRPSALAGVGLATSAPQVALLLFGGAVSDRLPRRTVLVARRRGASGRGRLSRGARVVGTPKAVGAVGSGVRDRGGDGVCCSGV